MGKEHSEKEKTILDSPSPKLNKSMIAYHETGDLFADTCEIVESAQSIAYAAVDTILVAFHQKNSFEKAWTSDHAGGSEQLSEKYCQCL